jgi:hypothetical protein
MRWLPSLRFTRTSRKLTIGPPSTSRKESVAWRHPETKAALEVFLRLRANRRPICASCGQSGPGYDRLPTRRFDFVPLATRARAMTLS